MQSIAEFMAESYNSNISLTWDLSGRVASDRVVHGGFW